MKAQHFNSRPRAGGDRDGLRHAGLLPGISIHAPARGATCGYQSECRHWRISIHAPARGATRFTVHGYTLVSISIHAPARGATAFVFSGHVRLFISIHAPARGATANLHKNKLLYICKMAKWRTKLLFSNSLMHKHYK